MWPNAREMISWLWQLIDVLKDKGEEEWARRLENSLRRGGTSTEIVFEVQLFLREFSKSNVPKKLKIKREIRQANKLINKTLRKWRKNNR